MRTTSQINQDIETAAASRKQYASINSEGSYDSYNPHDARIESLTDELNAVSQALTDAEWSLEVTAERRGWINSQGFATIQDAIDGCLGAGWVMGDLRIAIARHQAAGVMA